MFDFFKKKDKDAQLIKALQDAGSDLSKVHIIDFNFDFTSLEQAASIAQTIEKDGYKVKIFENDDDTFTIEAKKSLVPELDVMRMITIEFETLTTKYGGTYDGWGTEVVE